MQDEFHFLEYQKFNSRSIFVLLILVLLAMLTVTIVLLLQKENFILALLPFFATAVISVFIFSLRLVTSIDEFQISIGFKGLFLKKIYKRDLIESLELTQYDPLADYGGWGIRYGPKGVAYTVAGNFGLIIKLSSGSKLLLGTQDPNKLRQFLQKRWKEKFIRVENSNSS